MNKHCYKVTLNWYGELHTFYTNSSTDKSALSNAVIRLARKLGKSNYTVRQYYKTNKSNFTTEVLNGNN